MVASLFGTEEKFGENYYNIYFGKRGELINFDNNLIIIINGKIKDESNIFTTGKNKYCELIEDTYFLRVFNIEKEYTQIDTKDYIRGWVIGNFNPSIKKIKEYEIALLLHKKGEIWDFHYHKEAIEINILLTGKMLLNNIEIVQNEIFIIQKNIIACPFFLEDCNILCIKIPSVPGDKIII